MWKTLTAAALAAALPLAAPWAGEDAGHPHLRVWTVEGDFEDVALDLKLAVEGRGLVVDHVSHVGEMLNRTAGDVGAARDVYVAAEVVQFCSATTSRAVMEADPLNIAWCPYGIFVMQETGADMVKIGFRRMPDGPMQQVETLLTEIVEEATAF